MVLIYTVGEVHWNTASQYYWQSSLLTHREVPCRCDRWSRLGGRELPGRAWEPPRRHSRQGWPCCTGRTWSAASPGPPRGPRPEPRRYENSQMHCNWPRRGRGGGRGYWLSCNVWDPPGVLAPGCCSICWTDLVWAAAASAGCLCTARPGCLPAGEPSRPAAASCTPPPSPGWGRGGSSCSCSPPPFCSWQQQQ